MLFACVLASQALPGCGGSSTSGDAAMCHIDIGVGSISTPSRSIDYQFTTLCGACTPDGPVSGGPGAACSDSSDCRSFCCACAAGVRKTQACIDGLCATQAQACTDTPNVCSDFESSP